MPSFTVFRPPTAVGTLAGLGVVAFTLLLGFGLIFKGLSMEPALSQLWPLLVGSGLLALGALAAYWTWCCRTLSYVVDRNALSIRWGNIRQVIPINSIERLIPADEGEEPQIEGISLWPGHRVGRALVPDLGDVLFYSTHRSWREILYIQTPRETYAVSVLDPVFFAETVQSNQQRGPLFEQRQAVHRWGIAAQSFWSDSQARLFAALLAGAFFVMLGYVLQMYAGLDQTIELRFPAVGGVVRLVDKSELLDIPRTAAAFAAANLVAAVMVHSWERMVGYALLVAGIIIQVMLLIGAMVAVA
jgi:hypothetical protein